MILNVNVPDLPYEQLRGFKCDATRVIAIAPSPSCAARIRAAARCTGSGPSGDGADAGEGTDFDAVANGYVSVTPLQVDLTRHTALADIADWLRGRAGLTATARWARRPRRPASA